MNGRSVRADLPALGGILLAAVVLRTVAIGRESLWTDEALTLVIANWPVGEMALQPTDPTPFLYYALHKFLIPAGAGAAGVRAISLAAGLLAVPAMYMLGRVALGRQAGLLAAALLAVSAPLVDYSQEARAYSLLVLLTLLSATGLLWWIRASERPDDARRQRAAALSLFVSATALCFYTHLVAVFWIALTLALLLSFAGRARPARLVDAFLASAALAVLALPGLLRLVRQAAIPDGFHWLSQASHRAALARTADAFLPTSLWPGAAIPMLAIVTVLIALALRRHPPDRAASAVILAFLALPLLLWLFGFLARPIFMERTILFAIPGAILAISAALKSIPSARARNTATLATLSLFLAGSISGGLSRAKEPWGAADNILRARVRPGDLVLACPNWIYPALRHAAQDPLPAPVVVPYSRRPLIVEGRYGADPGWPRTVFNSLVAPNVRRFTQRTRPSLPLGRLPAPNAAWLVDSRCTPSERASLLRWLRGGSDTLVWRSRAGPDRTSIAISRIVPAPGADLAIHLGR